MIIIIINDIIDKLNNIFISNNVYLKHYICKSKIKSDYK
jgi:hypothetical protein